MADQTSRSDGLPEPAVIQRDLLAWFAANRRDLPWRRRRSLYGTWISEMMLQQTTVATVVPYWERFLERFPDVAALAAAPEVEVLALWSGLGYYRRARQLHAAARQIVNELDGRLPDSYDGWRRLPGIGPYAAGAITSIGLGRSEPAVDANVRRVLGRWLGTSGQSTTAGIRAIEERARQFVPADHPGDWNEALMELGAIVCLPKRPACDACPVRRHCGAGADGSVVATATPSAARALTVPVGVVMVAFLAGDLLWLEPSGAGALDFPGAGPPVRSDFTRLHQGLLTLPMTAWYPLPAAAADQSAALVALAETVAGFLGLPPSAAAGGHFRHTITRFRLTVAVVVARLPAAAGAGPPLVRRPSGQWAPIGTAAGLHVSQLARKALGIFVNARG